jgi:biotin carboxyl carrier protein
MAYIVSLAEKTYRIDVVATRSDKTETVYELVADGTPLSVSVVQVADPDHVSIIMNDRSYDVVLEDHLVILKGIGFEVRVEDELKKRFESVMRAAGQEETRIEMRAPMPGLVVAVEVAEGEQVTAGQGVAILEAMKMQNELRAPKAGVVREVRVQKGTKVDGGEILAIIE